MRTSSLENGGGKSPIKFEIRKDFFLLTVSFTFFDVFETVFYYFSDFFGLAKCDIPILFFEKVMTTSRAGGLR